MLKGKWYKVYWKPNITASTNRSIKVWAFDFNSAAATAKIKVAQKNPLFAEEKVIVTRIDKLSFDMEKEKFRSDMKKMFKETKEDGEE